MKIDRTNYESYIIDQFDGKLSPEQEKELMCFLNQNPDIAGDIKWLSDEYKNIETKNEHKDFSRLLKNFSHVENINESNIEEFCVAFHEGDLDEKSKLKLQAYLEENPDKKSLFKMHGNLHLNADPGIQFAGRRNLKKLIVVSLRKTAFYISAGIAAAIIISIWLLPEKDVLENNNYHVNIQHSESESQSIVLDNTDEVILNEADEKTDKQKETLQLAAIDTADSGKQDKIVIASLDPLPLRHFENTITPATAPVFNPIQELPATNNENESKKTSRKLFDRILHPDKEILFSALNAGVKGFNTLTENQMAIETYRNDKGMVTEIIIDGNNFELVRKVQRNIQN